MLHEELVDLEAETPAEHVAAYREALAAIVEAQGTEAVAAESGVDADVLEALVAGEAPELDLEDAAAIQAVDLDLDAETIYAEATDHVLLGMSMAVLDVETLASHYEGDLSPKAIQQRLERRAPMTLEEFARLEFQVASRR